MLVFSKGEVLGIGALLELPAHRVSTMAIPIRLVHPLRGAPRVDVGRGLGVVELGARMDQ